MTRLSNVTLSLAVVLILAACASHPPKVDCDGKLRPINAPAPVAHTDGAGHED